jgi:glycogen synthase
LLADGFKHIYSVQCWVADEKVTCGVHYNKIKGVSIFFIHHYGFVYIYFLLFFISFFSFRLFPRIYEDIGIENIIRQCCLFAVGTLQILKDLHIIPSLIVTNDWIPGLCAAYARLLLSFFTRNFLF